MSDMAPFVDRLADRSPISSPWKDYKDVAGLRTGLTLPDGNRYALWSIPAPKPPLRTFGPRLQMDRLALGTSTLLLSLPG